MRSMKLESFTAIDAGRTTLDLSYLEEVHFHIERIIDFITPSTPLFSIHQARATLLFFYVIAFTVIICFSTEYKSGCLVITSFVICFPLLCVSLFHTLLGIAYKICAFFCGASFRTIFGIFYYIHDSFGVTIFCLLIVYFSVDIEDSTSMFFIGLLTAFFADFIFGIISAPNQHVFLLFEIIAICPTLTLWILHRKSIITNIFYIFLPICVFYCIYFLMLIGLSGCFPKCIKTLSMSFFNDRALSAEYEAADDFQSYWNSALWRDDTQPRIHEKKIDDSSSSSENEGIVKHRKGRISGAGSVDEPNLLMNSKKKDFRFPRKEAFQLYKIDELPKHPFFICSLCPLLILASIVILIAYHVKHKLHSFLITFCGLIALFLFSIVFSSRAVPWSIMSITNLDTDTVNILWDHPSISLF